MDIRSLSKWLSIAAAAAVSVAGARSARADHLYGQAGIEVVVDSPTVYRVDTAPPAPYVEYRTPRPAGRWIWVSGSWSWDGYQWIWSSGRWVRPRPGYVYVEPYYDTSGPDCIYSAGYFAPRRRAHVFRDYVRHYRVRHRAAYPRRAHYTRRRSYERHRVRGPARVRRRRVAPRGRAVRPGRSGRARFVSRRAPHRAGRGHRRGRGHGRGDSHWRRRHHHR